MSTGPISKTGQLYSHRLQGVDCTEEEYVYLTEWYSKLPVMPAKEWVEQKLTYYRRVVQPKDQLVEAVAKCGLEPKTLSIEETLAQRGSRYGDFTDHAALAQGLMFRAQTFCKKVPATLEDPDGFIVPWKDRLNDVQRQSLTVIFDKIARILSGDPNYDDNWIDIQGYAKLVQDRLPQSIKKES